jgi:hypothetical protein
MNNKKRYIFYALTLFAMGIFQLVDWYFGSEDPIWHVFFYIILIPVASFLFTVGIKEKCLTLFLFPLYCVCCTAVVYVAMGNGGNALIHGYFLMPGYFDGIATILLGPFVGGFLGMLGRLVILRINRH